MNDNDNNNCNSIIVDQSKSKTSKIFCVICYDKVQLECIDPENYKWKCPRCRNEYVLFGYGGDIAKEEDELVSSHESNDEGPILFTVPADNLDSNLSILDIERNKNTDIKIPWYMKNTDTTTVEYHER